MRCTCHDVSDDEGRVRIGLHFDRNDLRLVTTPFGVVVHLEGVDAGGEPGAPALPRTRVRIAMPEPFWPHRLSIDVAEYEAVTDEPVLVVPAQRLQPGVTSDGPDQPEHRHDEHCDCCDRREWYPRVSEPFPTPEFTPPDPEKYAAAARHTRPPAVAVDIETAGRTKVTVVEITPLRLTTEGRLELCNTLELSVSYAATMPVGDRGRGDQGAAAQPPGREIDLLSWMCAPSR